MFYGISCPLLPSERARLEMDTARRAGDLTRMSELQYGRIPALEKQLAQAMQT